MYSQAMWGLAGGKVRIHAKQFNQFLLFFFKCKENSFEYYI